MWELLYGPSEANAFNKPKTGIRAVIAKKFNDKFSTERSAVEIDDTQLKNKLHSMIKCWKAANQLFEKTGNGDLPGSSLRSKALATCHYYYIWKPFASKSLNLNPREPLQLTKNLQRRATTDPNDTDESDDLEDVEIATLVQTHGSEQQFDELEQSKEPEQQSKEPSRPSKKQKKGGVDVIVLIEELKEKADENAKTSFDFQRQHLQVERQKLEIEERRANQKREIELRNADIDERIKLAELAKIEAEAEKVKLEAAKAKAELEVALAKAASWKEARYTQELEFDGKRGKVFVRTNSTSPVGSPK
ncbi:hypothetical protein BGX26_009102 [Mortierella sp. AD094]|nr:hypothetical protein BGX26_009102 [Mortierella sp. AD094]